MEAIKTLINNKDIRGKILFTIMMLFLFRVLSFIPVPFVNREVLKTISSSGILNYASTFTGGALSNFTIMATGISAYISASIIIQLLTYAIQALHDVQKSPGGDKIIKRYTVIVGVIMAFVISIGTTITMQNIYGILTNPVWYVYLLIATIHSIGTGLAVWIGETITQKGFGNGVSLLIFINIISSIPSLLNNTLKDISAGRLIWYYGLLVLFLLVVVLISIVISESSARKIPIQYSKASARGATSFGQSQNYFPIKVNLTGVMPIIFASTIMQIVSMASQYAPEKIASFLTKYLSYGSIMYAIIMSVLIFMFSYFYSALIFDPKEISDNIQSNGGCIPGIRPGKPTGDYIRQVNKNLTFIGAMYLSLIALIPTIIFSAIGFNGLATTSMMILVGVSLETCQKIKVETKSRIYKTF
ncbi:preprotein translocase subunit SecY [Thomasclavelia cocleata]|uniref:preprotein translocase subunit SecY n=1 Tax=Thomasclavelia cocleata TaxID=69824 RepID=UPI00256EFE5D|nr:preprotein translocase subunit SecY [Thomasclavelia cocleata]